MITASFQSAFQRLIGVEKGYVDDPNDPGGATCWGVTQRVAAKWGYTGPMQDLPLSTAMDIAKSEYWDPLQLDSLPPAVAFQVFDAAYNGGPAVRWLQQAVGTVQVDGVIGPATIAAVNTADQDRIIARFDGYRLLYLASLPIWPSFGRGWANRIAGNLLLAA